MAVDFKVNMDDERLKAVTDERDTAIKNSNTSYDTMIDDTLDAYDDLKDEQTSWEQKQTQLQQEQSDFAIQKIEQQKAQAEKDYIKEQKGAYADWKKESNKYGVNAEQTASMGMGGTGYSETAQVSMWNTYQNRVAVARDSFVRIQADYDNAMTEARLQNNAALAEIAAQAQQKRLELSLNALLAKNDLLEKKSARELAIKSQYDSKWQTILDQINRENQLAYQQEQDEIKNQQTQAQIQLQQDRLKEEIRQFNILHPTLPAVSGGGSGGGSGSGSGGSGSNNKEKTSSSKGSTTHVSSSGNTHGGAGKKWSTNVNASKKGKSMIDIIMSDPKYLPAVAKKKFGLSR